MIQPISESGQFPYISLRFEKNGTSENLSIEPLGSKRKMWVKLNEEPDRPWLLKFARPNTGEHWAEKIGHECAKILKLPSARVELARVDIQPAVIVENVIEHVFSEEMNQSISCGELIHGNEILAGRSQTYDREKQWGQVEHSWDNIISALILSLPDHNREESMVRFAGMLVLDGLIGNTDRHHENWALLRTSSPSQSLSLAPSFDHASSLGRELTDDGRDRILNENHIGHYVQKGHGAIFAQERGRHADNPLALVKWAARIRPEWFRPWILHLQGLPEDTFSSLLEKVPGSVMTLTSKRFVEYFLKYTHKEIVEIVL